MPALLSALNTAVHMGTISAEGIFPLGSVPGGRMGLRVSAIRVSTSVDIQQDDGNYWTLEFGLYGETGVFSPKFLYPMARLGLAAAGYALVPVKPPMTFNPGETIAMRARAFGSPVPFQNCTVILDSVPVGVRS